jgi:hypothetical protein
VTEPSAAEQATTGDIGIATYTAGAPAFLALRRGRLAVYRNGLVVGGEDPRALVVFRDADVTWDGYTLTYRGNDYTVGDTIELGGGQMNLSQLRGLRLPTGWVGTRRAFVVAPDD